jgi:hypothetical protein
MPVKVFRKAVTRSTIVLIELSAGTTNTGASPNSYVIGIVFA